MPHDSKVAWTVSRTAIEHQIDITNIEVLNLIIHCYHEDEGIRDEEFHSRAYLRGGLMAGRRRNIGTHEAIVMMNEVIQPGMIRARSRRTAVSPDLTT